LPRPSVGLCVGLSVSPESVLRTRMPFAVVSGIDQWMGILDGSGDLRRGSGSFGSKCEGATENARLELSAPSKMQRWKMRDWNYRHHIAGGGKCGTKQLWKAKTPAGLELLLLLVFTARCTTVQCTVLLSLVVCPSVCPSVRLSVCR